MTLEVEVGGERLAAAVTKAYQTDPQATGTLIKVIDQRRRQGP